MTWCILLLLYRDVIIVLAFTTCHRTHHTRKSIENTEKNPYLFSYLLHYIFILLRRDASPKKKTRCYSSSSSRIFFETHPKTTGLLQFQPSIFLFFASFRYFLLFRNTSLGKKQTKNMQHRSSNADTIRAESEKVRQANEERLREKRMVRRRLISFFL